MPLDCGARGDQPRFPMDGKISIKVQTTNFKQLNSTDLAHLLKAQT
jgi:hypothetical protein